MYDFAVTAFVVAFIVFFNASGEKFLRRITGGGADMHEFLMNEEPLHVACTHQNVIDVDHRNYAMQIEVVARLCTACLTQLPADYEPEYREFTDGVTTFSYWSKDKERLTHEEESASIRAEITAEAERIRESWKKSDLSDLAKALKDDRTWKGFSAEIERIRAVQEQGKRAKWD